MGLDLDLNNSCWIQRIPNFATNNINIWFFTRYRLSDVGKLDLIASIAHCLKILSVKNYVLLSSVQEFTEIEAHIWFWPFSNVYTSN